ncbi:sigma-70 family RNA polymerase sigma factor [Agromyces laixinhei]|uniref:sigma-70 family RNA polymerase sigma factor n=1 Tax=Agromyces laixinhei TaxID=2585717 RepID=UPI0012ECC7C4|nr:sigma-70 family RNA polymerase sigma factor [Agromyces laixinhei]
MPPLRTEHPADAALIERTRTGDRSAYGELWQRHSASARTVARSYSSLDPDDLVAESFTKIYSTILAGGGPTGAFRPYLFTTIRNTAAGWGRARHETTLETLESFEDPATSESATLDALDRSATAQAFRALPTRWQEVLWYSEVENMTPQQIAPLLGMSANSTAALAYRAREGLRQSWIRVHLRNPANSPECQWSIDRLGTYTRGKLRARETSRLEAHLDDCARCTIVAAEAREVGSRLALVLLPLTAGIGGATAYSAWLSQGAPVAEVAMGAAGLPSVLIGQVSGSATTGAGASGASAGSTAGAAAGTGSTAGGGATSATGLAALGGSGVVIGVGAGALVAAAAVAAVIIVPGIVAPEEPVARPAASSAPSESGPTGSTGDEPAAIAPVPAPPAAEPAPVTEAAPEEPDDSAWPEEPAVETSPTTPAPAPVPDPGPPPAPEPEPEPEPEPVDTVALPPVVNTADGANGLVDPLLTGTAEPGASIFVTVQSGEAAEPAAERASASASASDETLPAAVADDAGNWSLVVAGLSAGTHLLTVTQTDVAGNRSDPSAPIEIAMLAPSAEVGILRADFHGVPGATVLMEIDGVPYRSFLLDAKGHAQETNDPLSWLLRAVTVRYITADGRTGPSVAATTWWGEGDRAPASLTG